MKKCAICKRGGLGETTVRESITVANIIFESSLPAQRCDDCGESFVERSVVSHFERLVAGHLAERGLLVAPDAFRFARKASGHKAQDLARLLDTTPETVSKWENGKHPIPRANAVLLAELVLERNEHKVPTSEVLQAFVAPPKASDQSVSIALPRSMQSAFLVPGDRSDFSAF